MSRPRQFTDVERGEICAEYRMAKDQEEQVIILSELYATSTADIRSALYAGGEYKIGPEEIKDAAERILGGLNFGSLRNYKKAFAGIDAKTAKKIFKDFVYMPWGSDLGEDPKIEEARQAAAAALEAARQPGAQPKAKKPEAVNPPLTDPAREFAPEEVTLLVNGLLSIQAQDLALETQLRFEIEKKHQEAAAILQEAEERMADLREIEARIAQGRVLLQRLADLNAEEQKAAEEEKEK